MFIEITALLFVFQSIYATNSPNGCTCADDKNLAASNWEETVLQNMQHRMDLLMAMNENLRRDMTSYQHLMILRKEPLQPAVPEKANEQEDFIDFNESLIDIRANFQFKNTSTTTNSLPTTCAEALKNGGQNGTYQIKVSNLHEPFQVYCLKDNTSAWIVFQRRQDGSIDFYRRWCEYQNGFGNLEGEFFIGLDKLHALTQSTLHELWIQMEDFEGNKRWAKYRNFAIGGANEGYELKSVGAYAGDAGDSLTYHVGMKWTTSDVDHDKDVKANCAQIYSGAWWYNACHYSNLNGQYLHGRYALDQYGKGVDWNNWHGHNYSLKYVHMAIRPV